MTFPAAAPRRRRLASAAVLAIVVAVAACSGGDDVAGDPVPTLLTTPLPSTSTSSTSTTITTVVVEETSASTSQPATAAPTSTTTTTAPGEVAAPSGPDAPTVATTASTPAPASSSSTAPGPSSTGATSTSADIEPPPPSLTSTVPIPTASQPPDTTGGSDVDFVLGPRSIAGLQFGASRATVLERMRRLLGDPLRVDTLPECPGGPGTALQWFNAAVIITDRGLAFYSVGVNLEDYTDKPVPLWHTAAVPALVGATRAELDAAYPQQITYAPPDGLFTPFTITAGADAGMSGRLEGDFLQSVSAGAATC